MNAEQQRLQDPSWKRWGSYVSDRQWGTVREDYSANGDAWNYTTHDMARSKAWRWVKKALPAFATINSCCVSPWHYGIKETIFSRSACLG